MDRKEFEAIAPAIRESVVRMARRLAPDNAGTGFPDDVAQDTLLRLWSLRERLDSYRSVEALALTIARNRAIDLLRSEKGGCHVSIDDYDSPDISPGPDESLEATEAEEKLSRIMSSLPSAQQAIIRMRHIEDMEIDDIAKVTGSTSGDIRVALSRARNHIKELFLQQDI